MLAERPCELRDSDHRYVDLTNGTEMVISVTGVIHWFKPPYDGPPEAGWRGTHVHAYLEARLKGLPVPDPVSPEGIDCSDWFAQVQDLKLYEREILASELTMIDTKKSLGGQIDCIFRDSQGKVCLLDFKTKSEHWSGASAEQIAEYRAQAGGYLHLLTCKDSTPESRIWVDYCQTLVITPKLVKFLPPMTPDECSAAWVDCWDRYFVAARTSF